MDMGLCYDVFTHVTMACLRRPIAMTAKRKSVIRALVKQMIWYDSRYGHSGYFRNILQRIPLRADDLVLDIGCGSGWLSRAMAQVVTSGTVVGLDISRYVVRKTNRITRRGQPGAYENLAFIAADAQKLPFPDGHFNCAVTFLSLSFWKDPLGGLKEARRVLKENGRLYVMDTYGDGPRWVTLGVKIFNVLSPWKEKAYPAEEYLRLLQAAGFADVKQRKVGVTLLTEGKKASHREDE